MTKTSEFLTVRIIRTDERRVITEDGTTLDRSPMVEVEFLGTDDYGWGPTLQAALRHIADTIEWREKIAREKAMAKAKEPGT